MLHWLAKSIRVVVILSAIFLISTVTFKRLLKSTQGHKPSLNLIPEEIKPNHYVNSYPTMNQFLAGSPANIVINFDSKIKIFTVNIKANDKMLKTTNNSLDKSLIIKTAPDLQNGIYLVAYTACFENEVCGNGQFTFHIDDTRITEFANFANKRLVEVNIDASTPQNTNILVNTEASIQWNNKMPDTIQINSQPPIFNNYFPPLNSGETKKDQSFKYQFNDRGEYVWYLKNNPKIGGRILVQM